MAEARNVEESTNDRVWEKAIPDRDREEGRNDRVCAESGKDRNRIRDGQDSDQTRQVSVTRGQPGFQVAKRERVQAGFRRAAGNRSLVVVDKRSLAVVDKRSLAGIPENHEEHPRKERGRRPAKWCQCLGPKHSALQAD
jgi:hypothetical protein